MRKRKIKWIYEKAPAITETNVLVSEDGVKFTRYRSKKVLVHIKQVDAAIDTAVHGLKKEYYTTARFGYEKFANGIVRPAAFRVNEHQKNAPHKCTGMYHVVRWSYLK